MKSRRFRHDPAPQIGAVMTLLGRTLSGRSHRQLGHVEKEGVNRRMIGLLALRPIHSIRYHTEGAAMTRPPSQSRSRPPNGASFTNQLFGAAAGALCIEC